MKILLLCLVVASSIAAEVTPLPDKIVLRNGVIVPVKEVIRWQQTGVTVKSTAGAVPVQYVGMAPESRRIWEARGKIALPEQKKNEAAAATKAAEERDDETSKLQAETAFRKRVAEAIYEKKLVVGMTPEEAVQSWGPPAKKNISGGAYGSTEQWIYREAYVYFREGKLTSWQLK